MTIAKPSHRLPAAAVHGALSREKAVRRADAAAAQAALATTAGEVYKAAVKHYEAAGELAVREPAKPLTRLAEVALGGTSDKALVDRARKIERNDCGGRDLDDVVAQRGVVGTAVKVSGYTLAALASLPAGLVESFRGTEKPWSAGFNHTVDVAAGTTTHITDALSLLGAAPKAVCSGIGGAGGGALGAGLAVSDVALFKKDPARFRAAWVAKVSTKEGRAALTRALADRRLDVTAAPAERAPLQLDAVRIPSKQAHALLSRKHIQRRWQRAVKDVLRADTEREVYVASLKAYEIAGERTARNTFALATRIVDAACGTTGKHDFEAKHGRGADDEDNLNTLRNNGIAGTAVRAVGGAVGVAGGLVMAVPGGVKRTFQRKPDAFAENVAVGTKWGYEASKHASDAISMAGAAPKAVLSGVGGGIGGGIGLALARRNAKRFAEDRDAFRNHWLSKVPTKQRAAMVGELRALDEARAAARAAAAEAAAHATEVAPTPEGQSPFVGAFDAAEDEDSLDGLMIEEWSLSDLSSELEDCFGDEHEVVEGADLEDVTRGLLDDVSERSAATSSSSSDDVSERSASTSSSDADSLRDVQRQRSFEF